MANDQLRRAACAVFFVSLVTACADHPCHEVKHPELANQVSVSGTSTPVVAVGDAASKGTVTQGAPVTDSPLVKGHVLVYKADTSRQCEKDSGMSADEMEKQLQGIKVYSRQNRLDGKMHIQVCGSPTGKINIYEIDESALLEAEKYGFKRLGPKP